MKILIKKDLEILKQNGLNVLIIVILLFSLMGGENMLSSGMIWTMVIGLNLLANDTMESSKQFLFTLPFSKRDYINHIYLVFLVPLILFSLAGLIISHEMIDIIFVARSLGILFVELSIIALTNIFLANKKNLLNTIQVSSIIVFLVTLLISNNNLYSSYFDLKYATTNPMDSNVMNDFLFHEFSSASLILILGLIILILAYLFSMIKAKKMEV